MKTEDAVSRFLKSRINRSKRTVEWYTGCLNTFAELKTDLPTDPDDIDDFLGRLTCGDERVHGYFRAIRALYHFLERRRQITPVDNPIRMMDAPPVRNKEPRPLPPEDIRTVVNYPHPPKIGTAIKMIAATGCRLDEARTLQPAALLVTPFGPFARVRGKRGERMVPITHEVRAALLSNLPFPWTKEWMGHLIAQAFRAAGVKGSAINLRHSFGTYWEGEELALQEIMGHASLKTTKRYRKLRLQYIAAQYHEHAPLLALLRQPEPML